MPVWRQPNENLRRHANAMLESARITMEERRKFRRFCWIVAGIVLAVLVVLWALPSGPP